MKRHLTFAAITLTIPLLGAAACSSAPAGERSVGTSVEAATACPVPQSKGNLVTNGGFNTSMTGWLNADGEDLWVKNVDANGCSKSGSVGESFSTNYSPAQCVKLPSGGGNYYFGASFNYKDADNGSYCMLTLFTDTKCVDWATDDNYTVGPEGNDMKTGWRSYSVQVPIPSNANSANIQCFLEGENYYTYLDKVYVNKTNSF
jgi:hypothetical protein